MTWLTVATPPFTSIDQIDAVLAQLDERPAGMEARYIGATDDGSFRVVSLWQSKTHADRFFADKLGPAVAKVLGPEPTGISNLVGVDVQRSYVSEPVA